MTGQHTPRFADKLKIKLMIGAEMPSRATPDSAGFDCRARLDNMDIVIINPGEQMMIGLGFSFQPPEGLAGFLLPRSGLGTKKGVVLANTIGLIDNDYRNEVMACIKNTGKEALTIMHGERICQLVLLPVWMGDAEEVEYLESTSRNGGFGSTGTS